jgi:putative PEP-CTERM system histidine kinase
MIGFVVLARPRAPAVLNWESFALLLTIGQQVAGYLAEESATRTLLESKSLIDYSKNFAFVIHDVKNVAGQLALMIDNFPKYGEQAEFRADMLRGMEGSVKKLRDLINRLRPDAVSLEQARDVDPEEIIHEIASEFAASQIGVVAEIAGGKKRVKISPLALKTVLVHLTRNAVEASEQGSQVVVSLCFDNGNACIDVIDRGCGMSSDFVRDGLFAPLLSTKPGGHGIGAYQARELVRAAGGDLRVTTIPGGGTTMRVLLPAGVDQPADTHLDRTAAE